MSKITVPPGTTPDDLCADAQERSPDEGLLPARIIDAEGRCCGRKPLSYKKPRPHLFCTRCNAEFLPSGHQVQNWAYKYEGAYFRPTYPDQEPCRSLLAALVGPSVAATPQCSAREAKSQ